MLKPIVTYVGTINVNENRRDIMLVTDPLEVEYVLDYLGYPATDNDDPFDFSGMVVDLVGGDGGSRTPVLKDCSRKLYRFS